MDESDIFVAALLACVVLCAWGYPKLNAWTYNRRQARDARAMAQASKTSRQA